jgi:rSAM/selenodomain-associated transferase 1
MNKNALIIIAKYPEEGSVKTRLKGIMSDQDRLKLYITLLKHTVERLKAISGVDTFIAFAPEGSGEYFSQFNVGLISLHKGDLGIRMFEAFKEVFDIGYQKAALVGADIPDLSASIILSAMNILSDNDLVYGPAKDGGYYMVGMSKLIKEVFEDVPWSSDQTLKKSISKAQECNYSIGFTETLSDIDTIDDLKRAGLY